jgi:hypothetical protein
MKTEQFDDEFRKKLLGLDPSDEEVDRIYHYVSSNGNVTAYFSWGKFLIYGLAVLLLAGSLSFNYVQNTTNKKLLSSLDSLKSRTNSVDIKSSQEQAVRVDTVYVTRYIEQPTTAENRQKLLYTRQSPHPEIQQPSDSPRAGASVENTEFGQADSSGIAPGETGDNGAKSIALNKASAGESNTNSGNMPGKKEAYGTTRNEDNRINKAPYNDENDFPKASPAIQNLLADIGENSNHAETRRPLLSELSRIGKIYLSPTSLKRPDLKTPERLSSASKEKPKYYSESIKSALKKMDYYIGVSLDAGYRQVAASLLGELRITPKWSFQAGARWTEITARSYDTAEQYSLQTGKDFRTLYAPYVAQGVDLLNIEQNYQLVQIPLIIAYHYEIRPNWGLRFGLGTDLSIYSSKDIQFDYRENTQSFNKGEYNSKLAVKPFNDVTINLGLERRTNRLLFRISPYVSPQLQKTEFSSGNFSWGARAQVLYKFNR